MVMGSVAELPKDKRTKTLAWAPNPGQKRPGR